MLTLFGAAVSVAAFAQGYPTKPVRLIVPFAAGSTTDTLARLLGQRLGERWNNQVVVDNRPGAGGNIGAEIAARANPDGYTLLITPASHAINPSLYSKLSYDPVKDFAAVTLVAQAPLIIVINPQVPAASLQELLALARSKPRQLNYASGGSGSPSHLAVELLKSMAGVDMVHVPYKGGGPVITAVLANEVQLTAGGLIPTLPQVRAGRLKALAVTGARRSAVAPEVPPVAEAGVPGYDVSGWWGLFAPAATPQPIVASLQGEIARILSAQDVRERLLGEGIEPSGMEPDAFAAYLRHEVAKWAKAVKLSGARAD
ncbi:MAG: tripartite tricarboxylate transporter substrate binding protein [Pseudomonadota bacterium]